MKKFSKKEVQERSENLKLAKGTSSKPKDYTQRLLGLGQEIWGDTDPLEYIRKQRAEWDKR